MEQGKIKGIKKERLNCLCGELVYYHGLCKECYKRQYTEYNQKPEVKERMREYYQKNKARWNLLSFKEKNEYLWSIVKKELNKDEARGGGA